MSTIAGRRSGTASTALPSSASGEEVRAQLQERLLLLGRLGVVVSTSFLVAGVLGGLTGLVDRSQLRYHAVQLATSAILAGLWLACRRGKRSLGVLRGLDAGVLFALCQVSALLLWWSVSGDVRAYSMLLAVTFTIMARTLLVPSSPRRTLLVSGVSCAPFVWFVNQVDAGPHAAWLTLWSALAVTVATVGSGVIFGLRREVRDARRLGQYTLEQRLGEGGMGVVYKARHAMLRRVPPRSSCCGRRGQASRAFGASSARYSSPLCSPIPTRCRSSTSGGLRRGSSTTRWSTWRASTSTSSSAKTVPSFRRGSSTSSRRSAAR